MITQIDTLNRDIKALELLLSDALINNDIGAERRIYNSLNVMKSTLFNIQN